MRLALSGTEKCIVWKSRFCPHSKWPWGVAWGRNGAPFGLPTWFATWREAMDAADFEQARERAEIELKETS